MPIVPLHRPGSSRSLGGQGRPEPVRGPVANRTEAIRFAMYECQRRPQSVIMLPDGLELDGPLDEHDAGSPATRIAA